MADTANKRQLGILLSKEADGLLRTLHAEKEREAGLAVPISGYVEMLIRQEAERKGVKAPKRKA